MPTPIDDFDELTVPEAKSAIEAAGLSARELRDLAEYEGDHKDRVTLTGWLLDHADEIDEDDADVAPETAAETREPETVVVTAYSGGYHAGLWFDRPLTKKEVRRTTRIETAIEDGELVEVNERD